MHKKIQAALRRRQSCNYRNTRKTGGAPCKSSQGVDALKELWEEMMTCFPAFAISSAASRQAWMAPRCHATPFGIVLQVFRCPQE